ncbi:hypothetical protein HU200_066869 [Digitaria exilis]|uniref:Uncharacterized protein n=1 Tax=Digitaria exilis TaxID=1010633 RepID=A0A835DWR4_9POAL|nr:hypothetical protein HU200_066869 [Digitaria exilis]
MCSLEGFEFTYDHSFQPRRAFIGEGDGRSAKTLNLIDKSVAKSEARAHDGPSGVCEQQKLYHRVLDDGGMDEAKVSFIVSLALETRALAYTYNTSPEAEDGFLLGYPNLGPKLFGSKAHNEVGLALAHHNNSTTASVPLEWTTTLKRGSTLEVDDHPQVGASAMIEAQPRSSLPHQELRPGLCDPSTPWDSLHHATATLRIRPRSNPPDTVDLDCYYANHSAHLEGALILIVKDQPSKQRAVMTSRQVDATEGAIPASTVHGMDNTLALRTWELISLSHFACIPYYEQHELGDPHRCWTYGPVAGTRIKTLASPTPRSAIGTASG